MATESAATPNGIYNGYQAQDHPANTTLSASQSNSTSGPATKPDALEIGWYFVEQYYTTLSKNPERIHLFYSKKSQLVTGKEAEKVMPCVGQKVSAPGLALRGDTNSNRLSVTKSRNSTTKTAKFVSSMSTLKLHSRISSSKSLERCPTKLNPTISLLKHLSLPNSQTVTSS